MRFPSFIRLPRSRRFDFTPRYYDPVREDIEERTRQIERDLNGKKAEYSPKPITFERKSQSIPNASFLQMIIAVILCLLVVGWLYYGNQVFYAFWLALPVYLYFRFRNFSRK